MTSIAGVEIGPGQPCRVVAELSNAHNGDLGLALRLIEECAAAGADFVKLQCYTPSELVALRGDGPAPSPWGDDGTTMRQLYERAQTPHDWFCDLVDKCAEMGVPWFSSVFGIDSLQLLAYLKCPAYKIAALDVGSDFARLVGAMASGVPIVASGRGERIPWADLTLFCPPGYPQALEHFTPDSYQRAFTYTDGLSYHGTTWDMPAWAAEYGAHMIEVHVQLDDVPSELEANVSLTVSQLKQLCESAHKVRAA